MKTKTTKRLASAMIVLPALLMHSAWADVDLDYEFIAGVAHTNNIDLNPDDGLDETAGIYGLVLDLEADTRAITADVGINVERRVYTKDTNEDETIGSVVAQFDAALVDRILSWQASNSFGQALIDVFAPDNPENRQDVNVFSTGPVLTLPLNSSNQLQIAAEYRDLNFEDSPQNNDAIMTQLSYSRALNANRTLALNLSNNNVDFDRPEDPDFDLDVASVSLTSSTSRSTLSLEVGANSVDFGNNRDDLTGALIRAAFSRDLSSRLALSFSYDQELSDSGQLFAQFAGNNAFGNNINPAVEQTGAADALEQRSAVVNLTTTRRTGNVSIGVRYFDFDFDQTNNQDRDGLGIFLT
ncbi:MAG: hypothetical protein AAF265_13410, partial [Pseudomonadota bacterium]